MRTRSHGNRGHDKVRAEASRSEGQCESESFVTNRLLRTFPVFLKKQIGIFINNIYFQKRPQLCLAHSYINI